MGKLVALCGFVGLIPFVLLQVTGLEETCDNSLTVGKLHIRARSGGHYGIVTGYPS